MHTYEQKHTTTRGGKKKRHLPQGDQKGGLLDLPTLRTTILRG